MNLREFFRGNAWWGKAFGAFFGFLIWGPAGAFFGILIGNVFDKSLSVYFSNPHLSFHLERRKNVQKIFFESTFSVMGHIAKADGRVSEEEIMVASELMNEMGLNRNQKAIARDMFSRGKRPDFDFKNTLLNLKHACKDNKELLKLFVDIQYRAAKADALTTAKIRALDTVLINLGFAPLHQQFRFHEDFSYNPFENQQRAEDSKTQQQQGSSSSQQRVYQRSQSSLDHAFAILEISPSNNKQEVKRAYRKLMSKNHPDKLISQGLPQEMIRMANEKTQKIIKAYELISKTKGW